MEQVQLISNSLNSTLIKVFIARKKCNYFKYKIKTHKSELTAGAEINESTKFKK